MKNKIIILTILTINAVTLNPDPINAIKGTGIVHTTLIAIGGINPIAVSIALKMNKAPNPITQGTNINGFNTIGKPYIIGSAILKIEPAIDNLPNTLNLFTLEIQHNTAIGNTLKRT